MTSTANFIALNGQAKKVTEQTVEAWKQGAKTITDQANRVTTLPALDLTEPVTRYFEYVQKVVDLNRDLATKWAELVGSLSGSFREQAESFGHIVEQQTEKVAELTLDQVKKAEQVAQEQASKIEQAKDEQTKDARKVEREQARKAREQAREPYEGLTKAELADKLAERDLPKSGNVDELIERLVSADSE